MSDARTLVREPESDTPAQFATRVWLLAASYSLLLIASLTGLVLLIQWGRLLVTLTQRSNVETLALLFFIAIYAYFAVLSWRGAVGALRLLLYLLLRLWRSEAQVEASKIEALGPPRGAPPSVALNLVLQREGQSYHPFDLDVADDYGFLGRLRVNGAQLLFLHEYRTGSTDIFIYFVHQVNKLLDRPRDARKLDIVEWRSISDEQHDQYLGLVEFARSLQARLGLEQGWPSLTISQEQCRELEQLLSAICPALRNEAFLPDWEYSADHKLPLIPEPLGLFSLGHSEKRVDPVSSMGAAAVIVSATVVVFTLLIAAPPWVPGS
jgi:hypothetical protein